MKASDAMATLSCPAHIPSYGKSQLINVTAPTAMPTPNTIPARARLESPSPKANNRPPTTIATRLSPLAIAPVKAVRSVFTAFSHGDACANASRGTNTIAMRIAMRRSADRWRLTATTAFLIQDMTLLLDACRRDASLDRVRLGAFG